jgi:hypothetical protein
MSTWIWISKERRKDIIKMSLKHAEKVIEVVEHAVKVLEAYSENNAKAADKEWGEVFRLEREADDIKRSLLAELSKETFHPIDRETIVRLVLSIDDIASYAKAWSRRVILLFDIRERPPESIVLRFLSMGRKVLEASKTIREAIERLAEDPKKVLELANAVERIEEEVDDIRGEVFKEIIRFCENSKTSLCILAKDIMDTIENGADKCEDVADVLRSLALLTM